MEDVIHHPSEGCRQVSESKEHDGQFEQSLVGTERGLFLVAFPDLDVVVSPMYIELFKVLGAAKLVNEFRDEW